MAQKKSPTRTLSLDPFTTSVTQACTEIGVAPFEGTPPDTRGRWQTHSEKLNSTCAGIRDRGGRFVSGLSFDARTMIDNGARYETLCGAEQTLLGALRDVRAAKEGTKLLMIEQSGQVLATLACQAEDPRTPAEDKRALKDLSAPALGLIQATTDNRVGKARSTKGKNAGFRAVIADLTSENQALREVGAAPPPPAPRSSRRKSPR